MLAGAVENSVAVVLSVIFFWLNIRLRAVEPVLSSFPIVLAEGYLLLRKF